MITLGPKGQKVIAYLLIAAATALAVWAAWYLWSGYLEDQRTDAVQTDRDNAAAYVGNVQIEAERAAQADAERDRLVAERAQAEQMEAINASLREPGGDPVASLYERMRGHATPTR